MKIFERETYNEVIENMIEDNLELNEKTKKELEKARKSEKSICIIPRTLIVCCSEKPGI